MRRPSRWRPSWKSSLRARALRRPPRPPPPREIEGFVGIARVHILSDFSRLPRRGRIVISDSNVGARQKKFGGVKYWREGLM